MTLPLVIGKHCHCPKEVEIQVGAVLGEEILYELGDEWDLCWID